MPSYDFTLAEALVRGYSQRKSAGLAGISEGMVRKRLQQEDFQALLAQKRDELGFQEPLKLKIRELSVLLQSVYDDISRFDRTRAELQADETRKHLGIALQWLDEWVWLLEEECAG